MGSWECESCSREFVAEHSTACPGCGGIDTVELPENVAPGANGEPTGAEECLAAVREILHSLCSSTYEMAFQGAEWERLNVDSVIMEVALRYSEINYISFSKARMTSTATSGLSHAGSVNLSFSASSGRTYWTLLFSFPRTHKSHRLAYLKGGYVEKDCNLYTVLTIPLPVIK